METSTSMTELAGHWIDGAVVGDRGGRRLAVEDPAKGVVLREVELADAVLLDDAVSAASAAAGEWGARPAGARGQVLRAWHGLISGRGAELITLMGEEQGKVRTDAEGELMRGLETLDLACSGALMLKGEISPQVATGVDAFSMRMPLGVVAAITPFNFPLMAPLYLCSIAIACGNAVILKPSERVPSASLLIAELAREAGLPDGVLNVVQGDRVVVDMILDHPGIAAVSFIGSTPVAKHVHARGSASGKRVQAFAGAKNHMVVMPDADLAFAADSAVSAGFGSSGQRCMAVSVVVAVGGIADDLIAAITDRMGAVRVGPASDPDAEMGPLISAAARDRVRAAITGAAEAGARVVVDGRKGHDGDGYFVGPTLIDAVTRDLDVYRDEVFGPVLSVVRVEDLDSALSLIAENPYGNGAAIFTCDGGAARRFEQEVTAGMVGINVPIPVPMAYHSFGGWKQSLFGDLHVHGPDGVRFYTRGKVVTTRWPDPSHAGVNLGFPTQT
jgi:malonate-semialdehyde dehydrogenase (acetylating) / methylmalonate-semialdehyde dehydrogenase